MKAARVGICLALTGGIMTSTDAAVTEQINPYPRALVRTKTLHRWGFERDTELWVAVHHCTASAGGRTLRITSTGGDPYLHGPAVALDAPSLVKLRMKCSTGGRGQLFWTTARSPNMAEKKSARFDLNHDGEWHEYAVPVEVQGTLTRLRLDPGSAPGSAEVDWIELSKATLHPLEIERVETTGREVAVHLRNHGDKRLDCTVGREAVAMEGKSVRRVVLDADGEAPFEAFPIVVKTEGLPDVRRTVFLHRPHATTDWIVRRSKALTLRLARDGSGARLEREGDVVAIIAPLVHVGGVVPRLRAVEADEAVRFRGEGITATVALRDDEVAVSIESARPCEGPVLRALGPLEQGLFAGLESLGKGERSSSKKDIETDEHLRYAPDPLKVTMPLMACVTERGTAAVLWEDMSLRPVYAVPNFFDGSADHRMTLRGTKIETTILCRPRRAELTTPLDEVILWAVKKRGLPPLLEPPRDRKAQLRLCMDALEGPLMTVDGWGHCVEARWKRRWFVDHASTVWRLTGKVPEMPEFVPGGSHVRNESIYFVTGRTRKWLALRKGEVAGIIRRQKPDGSFRYDGKYRRGHFEDTASGHCARPAAMLLEFAHLTGDAEALSAGVKTLDYMKRFRTPRGAQVWEVALHTPDILASAYLVWAYVRGYELTGDREYLARARSWALSGVPFVYQWTRYPVMLYATVPVLGATNWRAPNWIGLPVQWCGGVYAYALALLDPHEKTLDWAKLARGILIAGEQMQHPSGKYVGCLPDAWDIPSQGRRPWTINPCALVSLRLVLDKEVDSLAVAVGEGRTGRKHRLAAPFPVTIRDGKAHLSAKRGVAYQVLVDGRRIIDVESRGADVVPLE
ncbi:MAG: prenyltransferase/squalene oxidase repeat-containing protein [Planctomycetota bacterium]|jgi:hypothetical protein